MKRLGVCVLATVLASVLAWAYAASQPSTVVNRVKAEVQPLFDRQVAAGAAKTMAELAKGETLFTNYKLPVRDRMNADPWGAMGDLEQLGRNLAADSSDRNRGVEGVLYRMLNAVEPPRPSTSTMPHLSYDLNLKCEVGVLKDALSAAETFRSQALERLSKEERQTTFARAAAIVKEFGPQEELTKETEPMLKADRAFVEAARTKIDWDAMVTSAGLLLSPFEGLFQPNRRQGMVTGRYASDLVNTCRKLEPHASRVPGMTGQAFHEARLPQGWLIVGGFGPNTYDVREPVAMIVDLGGNDVYKGGVASSKDPAHGNSAVVDLAGNDTYAGNELGVATGVLGCGVLLDMKGDDVYSLKNGSGGVGLAGIGVLWDRAGNDRYTGTRYVLGSAIAGLGLVLDDKGIDSYSCEMYGIGLGGPCAVGAVVDLEGNDDYRCGFQEPSGYNEGDGAKKVTDPNYQYEGWGLGMGLGRRLFPFTADGYRDYTMAGGIGALIDVKGQDKYRSSNFSLGCGYFFGAGLCMDFAGDDRYFPARYGVASGAHYAMGLFIDCSGNDLYRSTGPTYNCGCSWDHSAFLFVDAAGNDLYELKKSAGPGRGDIGSWGVAADLAGDDVYSVNTCPGSNSRDGLSAFLDLGGKDLYDCPGDAGNGKTLVLPPGGVFCDR